MRQSLLFRFMTQNNTKKLGISNWAVLFCQSSTDSSNVTKSMPALTSLYLFFSIVTSYGIIYGTENKTKLTRI